MKRLLTFSLVVLCVFLYVCCSKESSPANGHVELGVTYAGAGEYDKAIAEFKKAIAIDPNYGRAYNWLGLTYSNQGKYDLAVRFYQKAISINPETLWFFHYRLARLYSLQDKKALSIESLRKAISLDKDVIGMAKRDSDFDNIRESPEFQALIRPVE